MTAQCIDINKVVMQQEWDEEREVRQYGSIDLFEEIEMSVEEIINEAY